MCHKNFFNDHNTDNNKRKLLLIYFLNNIVGKVNLTNLRCDYVKNF